MFPYGLKPTKSGHANQECLALTKMLLITLRTSTATVHNQHMYPHQTRTYKLHTHLIYKGLAHLQLGFLNIFCMSL